MSEVAIEMRDAADVVGPPLNMFIFFSFAYHHEVEQEGRFFHVVSPVGLIHD